MQLIVLVLAFLAGYFIQQNRLKFLTDIDALFNRYTQFFSQQLADKTWCQGTLGLFVYLLLPALLMALIVRWVGEANVLFLIILHTLVLIVCIQPLTPLYDKDPQENGASEKDFNILQLVSVFFWYLFLGPFGAVVARLCFQAKLPEDIEQNRPKVAHVIGWLPCRCLILSYALVGNFGRVIEATQNAVMSFDQDHQQMVSDAAGAALWPESEPQPSNRLMMALYRRAILSWVTVVAITSLAL